MFYCFGNKKAAKFFISLLIFCLTKRCAPQNRLTIIFAAGIDNNTVVIPSHIKIEQLAYITQS